jgi:mannose-6-phosphate isomerase-like protein (cupin superfamily)
VEVGSAEPVEVASGDTVFIPAGSSQRITNLGKTDLTFYCIRIPKFSQDCYFDEESL